MLRKYDFFRFLKKKNVLYCTVLYLIPMCERLGGGGGQPDCGGGADEGHVEPEGQAVHRSLEGEVIKKWIEIE